ncbi:MAG TPA: ExeM/NucH family extracellular endonuclease [Phycicoccus sp.]|nr:ExeM/NucH family extracellular endonuclease [Phycicoccus sp.]
MTRMPLRRLVARAAVAALAIAAPVALTPTLASAATTPTDLFFSEYIEGSSNNKALEIYNGTGAAVDLAAGGYTVQMFFNGSASAGLTINLVGTVTPGDVFVLAHSSAVAAILAQADQTNGAGWYNGDDAIVLRKGSTVIDSIGQVGVDPGAEWGTGATSTADNTLRRKATICAGDPDASNAFDPAVEWDGFAVDTFGGLGTHTAECAAADQAPAVTATTPAAGGTLEARANMTVTFSEPVTLVGNAFALVCTTSGSVDVDVTGGPQTYTVNPSTTLQKGESCTLTVSASAVHDVDENDPPDTMSADANAGFTVVDTCPDPFTTVPAIQGSGPTAAITGSVTTEGVVVADYEGASPKLRGFYLQDSQGDGNPATSDGIFVFNGNNDSVSVGDLVRVSGTAAEFNGQTQVSATSVVPCGEGTVAPTVVALPQPSTDFFERYEGMLVRFDQTLYVTEHFQLGRFGQVTVSSGARLRQPTNVVAPGPKANALQAQNDLNRVIVDDTLQNQNPDPIIWGRGGQPLSAANTLRGGDTTTGATGIMTYTWAGNSASGNAWRLRPLDQSGAGITFTAANPRPTSAPDVGGAVQVAGMNVLNYFNTLDNAPNACRGGVSGPPMDCRGAETPLELQRQTEKTSAAIAKLDADVIGVNEIENDGYGTDSALATLVDAVNAKVGAGTYAYIDADARTGQVDSLGDDAIKVGFLYKPAAVVPVGQTAVLNTKEFVNGGDSAPRNRPSLAQAWRSTETGGVFITDVNHLKSKGSECETPDTGDGQGNCAIVRTNAVRALLEWLASDPTGTGDQDVLLVGDYNSYAKETPIATLEAGGFTNLVEKYQGEDAYSYVFDGQWGYLDQALGSASMTHQVTGVADYHINSDEPSVLDYNTNFKSAGQIASLYAPDEFRVSDHDPVLIGLTPNPTLDTAGFEGPLGQDGRVNKAGSTLPVKVSFAAADGSEPTDLHVAVTITLEGQVVETGTMRWVDDHWEYLVRTGDLPDPRGTYTVTALVLDTGQTVTGTFRLRP